MTTLLAPFVDRELLATPQPWLDMVYEILDELILQGHLQAAVRKQEMEQLQQIFRQSPTFAAAQNTTGFHGASAEQLQGDQNAGGPNHETGLDMSHFGDAFLDDAMWRTPFTADQLITVAEGLDLDGIEWMTTGSSN